MMFLVTGGAGFIGSHFTDYAIAQGHNVVVLDALTYAGNLANVNPEAEFYLGDICDKRLMRFLLSHHSIDRVYHFAAESHVERSFAYPDGFIHTNVHGTLQLLDALHEHKVHTGKCPLFVHISTDEVYGSVTAPATEDSPLRPGNPYSASKAAAEAFVSAYSNTYGIKSIILRMSNNYGPRQFPEKLVPLCIRSSLRREPIIIHGDGWHVREWIYVEDAAACILKLSCRGTEGSIYNVKGKEMLQTYDVVGAVRKLTKTSSGIQHTPDRPGNDRSYNICGKRAEILGVRATTELEDGLMKTIKWIKANDKTT